MKTFPRSLRRRHPAWIPTALLLTLPVLTPVAPAADTVVEGFEYASPDELVAWWTGSPNTGVTTSDSVSPNATGTTSMALTFSFPTMEWATEWAKGTDLPAPVAIAPEQFISFRVQGDPAFAAADFRNLYLYAYDIDGNFGRWGAPVPATTGWQVRNHTPASIEKPWDSPQLPDLSQIVRFAFFQYGSQAALPPYTATVLIDELSVRDTALMETPQGPSTLVERFEYATTDELASAWKGSANAVLSRSDAVAPRSTGRAAMKATFSFPSGEWATETLTGPTLSAPISIGPSQYVSFRVQGDPAFAGADFRNLFLYLYDANGNFGRWGAEIPTTTEWQVRNHQPSTLEKPWDSPALPDLNRIVRAAFVQYGSQGVLPAYTASIQIDDLDIRDTPLIEEPLPAELVIEAFEYPSDDDLLAAWRGGSGNVVLSSTDAVSPRSPGKTALRIEFNFGSSEWATESLRGPDLPQPIALARSQYLTLRIQGDPAFAVSDFHNLYLYAYDEDGKFGRWGTATPDTADWKVLNFSVAAIEKPWDSPELPNLDRIVRFAFFQYGSQTAIEPYMATVLIDDITVRSSPLMEFPPASPARTLIDDFEGYADTTALLAAYTYQNSPAATVTTASLASPAPQGTKALQLAIDFAAGQYPWGSVRSGTLAPFSMPTNAAVSFRFKGDPTLASLADGGTAFWLSLYDQAGNAVHYVTPPAPVSSPDWTTLQARYADFLNTTTVDTGNLVRWRLLVQAYEGTSDRPALSGAFQVDDIRIGTPVVPTTPPRLTLARDGARLGLRLTQLTAGASYEIRTSPDLRTWTAAATLTATADNTTWNIEPTGSAAFYQVLVK